MGRLFGTDGVRGIANSELTPELAYKLGKAGAYVLTAISTSRPKILVGMDTRISGQMLEAALVAGICSAGAEAVCLGVVTTPAVAHLTKRYGADAGAVISASHNSFEFNGIKFFDSRGYKLPDAIEDRIEQVINEQFDKIPSPQGEHVGVRSKIKSAASDYAEFLKNAVNLDLSGMKIAIDCANGAAYEIAPMVFKSLGADVCAINDKPDGVNINKNCGSTSIDGLCDYVKNCGADVGLAFDGDADRVLAVDESGCVVDGDKILAITGLELKKQGRLEKDTIVVTVMSNIGLDIMAAKHGIKLEKTKVGDRYVLEKMMEKGYILGGEQSGHIIFSEHATTGDGMLTALNLLKAVKISGRPLSELASVMETFPQVLVNARVKESNKHRYMEDDVIAGACSRLEKEFGAEGRVLIRPSGTEPFVRVMIEGKDKEYITAKATELAKLIESRMG